MILVMAEFAFPLLAILTIQEMVNGTYTKKKILAVSYTHLRAHETVLDLVCRLLLEKKKHTNNLMLVQDADSTAKQGYSAHYIHQ